MSIEVFDIQSTSKKEWDSLISFPLTSVYQSYSFAVLMKELLGVTPKFLISDNARLLFFEGYVPFSFRNTLLHKVWLNISRSFFKEVFWERGPVFISSDSKRGLFELLTYLSSKYRIKYASLPLYFSCRDIFLRGLGCETFHTFLLNLRDDLDNIKKKFKKELRKSIRKGAEKGITVKLANREEVPLYYDLLKETRNRTSTGFNQKLEHLYLYWDIMHEEFDSFEVFIAYKEGSPLGALGILHFNKMMIEVMSASSNYALRLKLPVGDILKWEVIKWGKKKGLHYYDLAGVNIRPKTKKEENILRFKRKWGGELVELSVIKKN